ncbi:uncharacterized protein PHACADRAFT_189607 [Phanerochaete carnosa HHB-10118-sp]|uniref:Uncharacterized protein n=1 Tax=Phanerochaete carnosa (strain HHB-10118-sp) TaxID=650164 RepID=K5VC25_PHACS|nr:uncharacterized protein PHACADRAFT_189607 [Phanerochaete carnosa HHB-10118-sp]EKM60471.1 hypothetical protein PHACADRAFT_189607 [Phanerochaete carnosa HHB-10118-sp]
MSSSEATDVALDVATPILDLAGDALGLVPLPGLPLIAKGLGMLVERVKIVRENKGARSAFLSQADELKAVIDATPANVKAVVTRYDGAAQDKKDLLDKIKHSDDLQKRIESLKSTIDKLQGRAEELKGGNGFSGFLKGLIYGPRNQAILSDMKEEMAGALELFKLGGSISIENILDKVAQDTKEIQDQMREDQRQLQRQLQENQRENQCQQQEHQRQLRENQRRQQEAEDQRVIDSIPRADAGYRSVDELKSGFTQGTREGLFEELEQWSAGRFAEDEPKRACYLTGGAGLGKSSISHQLCVRHDSPDHPSLRLGASFFFVRGGGNLEDAHFVFSTLTRQLAASQPTLRPHIVSTAREYLNHGDRQQMQHAFGGLLRKALIAAPADQASTLIVIDGIDECKDRRLVPELLRCLFSLVRELPWLYIFAASRPEPHILSVLASPDCTDVLHHMRLEDAANRDGDVEHYLKETVPKIPSYADYLNEHPDALGRLVSRAAGVFIFARITVNFLDEHHSHPKEWFELVLSGGGPAASPLDALYLQILRSAFPPEDLCALPSEHRRLIFLLRFVALESSWINAETVAFYERDLSADDVSDVVDRLRSVLMIDKDGDVMPLHASFGEFLVDEHRCSDMLYHVDKSGGHAYLACACLATMSFENRTYCLQEPYARPQHARVNFHIMVGSWWGHVQLAKHTVKLEEQLSQFVQDIRLALHMWIVIEFSPGLYDYGIRCIWDYLQPSGARKAICSEFLKFGIYVKLWQLSVLTSPSRAPPQIASDDISQAISRLPHEYQDLLPVLDLTVDDSRLTRYQAIMTDLWTKIGRDEATRELWCKDIYVDKEQTRLAGQDADPSQPSVPLHSPTVTTPSSSSITSVTPKMVSEPALDGDTVPSAGNGGTAPVAPPDSGLVACPTTSRIAISGIHTRRAPTPADEELSSIFSPPTPSSAEEEPTAPSARALGEGEKRAKTY